MQALNVRVKHVFRESNMVADFLAKERTKGRSVEFFGDNFGHGRFRGLVRTDRWGLPFVRSR